MTRRFFVDPATLAGDEVTLAGDLAHRLTKVLRLRPGAEIALFDGSGREATVRIEGADERTVQASVVERYDGPPEPRVRLNLYQSITKGERFEWLLEKGTEIGVARFVPLIAARAVVMTKGEGNRAQRWRRIVVEAAEQCGRSAVPEIGEPVRFDAAVASAPGVLLLPYEAAGDFAPSVQSALSADIDALFALSEVSVFIGPEGGFEPAEVAAAAAAGAAVVTMGARVLRSETAGLVAATLVMQAAGELG
ncbi:MAG: 16S rRNA (uracil(1498)-N(3))-methyltransferase [Dehalococcoidia bacterium]|nr:MAG: 16S rRNA (uracil(1498)-N(3))-methyltransferase [Dehalococcoidia bacterium]